MTLDIDKYRTFADRFDLSEDQKLELIHIAWSASEGFVDRAFGLHPDQQGFEVPSKVDSNAQTDHLNLNEGLIAELFKHAAREPRGKGTDNGIKQHTLSGDLLPGLQYQTDDQG